MSNYEIKLNKIELKDGMPDIIHYSIKNIANKDSKNISKSWRRGWIAADKSLIFSSSFKRLYKIEYDEQKNEWQFIDPDSRDRPYSVVRELIEFVDATVAEYFILK
jgi:hypothetical protein